MTAGTSFLFLKESNRIENNHPSPNLGKQDAKRPPNILNQPGQLARSIRVCLPTLLPLLLFLLQWPMKKMTGTTTSCKWERSKIQSTDSEPVIFKYFKVRKIPKQLHQPIPIHLPIQILHGRTHPTHTHTLLHMHSRVPHETILISRQSSAMILCFMTSSATLLDDYSVHVRPALSSNMNVIQMIFPYHPLPLFNTESKLQHLPICCWFPILTPEISSLRRHHLLHIRFNHWW